MKFIKSLLVGLLFSASGMADTGSFSIESYDFKNLFNSQVKNGRHLVQITPTPWAGSYWAYGRDGIAVTEPGMGGVSPAAKYDQIAGRGSRASDWELEDHSCKNVSDDYKEGCKGWWGHCNAWSAAAILEDEPREANRFAGREFSVADKKAYLTEIWMSSSALFAGDTDKSTTTGSWVCDPNHPTSRKRTRSGSTAYDAFWDVSPKTFFLIFTNYLGLANKSVVIDRFSGDQVWNQPVVGYEIRDVNPLGPTTVDGERIYQVAMNVDIFWANDGVYGQHVTPKFDIKNALQNHNSAFKESFHHRSLGLRLYFDAPVEIGSNGKIRTAGRMVGEGVWENQLNCDSLGSNSLDQGHPDFIWRPTYLTSGGNANPYIKADKVYEIVKASSGGDVTPTEPTEPTIPEPTEPEPSVQESNFEIKARAILLTRVLDPGKQRRLLRMMFGREFIRVERIQSIRRIDNTNNFVFKIKFVSGTTKNDVKRVLLENDIRLYSINRY